METIEKRYKIDDWMTEQFKLIVNDKVWSVDLVMDYYGEWLGSERAAIVLMEDVREIVDQDQTAFKSLGYGSRLRELRQLLIDKYGFSCEDIPFTVSYRRRNK